MSCALVSAFVGFILGWLSCWMGISRERAGRPERRRRIESEEQSRYERRVKEVFAENLRRAGVDPETGAILEFEDEKLK